MRNLTYFFFFPVNSRILLNIFRFRYSKARALSCLLPTFGPPPPYNALVRDEALNAVSEVTCSKERNLRLAEAVAERDFVDGPSRQSGAYPPAVCGVQELHGAGLPDGRVRHHDARQLRPHLQLLVVLPAQTKHTFVLRFTKHVGMAARLA